MKASLRVAAGLCLVAFLIVGTAVPHVEGGNGVGKPPKRPNPKTTVIVHYTEVLNHHRPDHAGGPGGPGDPEPPPPDDSHQDGHYELIGGVWPDGDGNAAAIDPLLTFYIDLDGFPAGADVAIANGFQAWEDATGGTLIDELIEDSNLTVEFGDGLNTYSMRNLGGGGVLAATFITWDDLNGNGDIDPLEPFLEMDIVHNATIKWGTAAFTPKGQWWDLQGVAAHEVGHAFGLDHSGNAHAEDFIQTMYAAVASKDTSKRTLESGDIAGIQSIFLGYGAP